MSKTARSSPASRAGTAVYAYAVVRAARVPALAKLPAGLPGAGRPRALELGSGLWLVVADVPLSQYGTEVIEANLRDLQWVGARALGHETVVESLAGKYPTVPLKLFTLFGGEERARAQLGGDRARLGRVMKRIEGCAEWGVRVGFDELAARRKAQAESRAEARGNSGTAFLLKKKKEQQLSRELLGRAQAQVEAVFDALAALARDARRRPPGQAELGARILLEAAFLVAAKDRKRFEKAASSQARALSPAGYTLTLTGPWPVYNFVAES